jgi:hypothetical protein
MEPINYNRDLEQLLAQSAEECESLGILHLASYEKYNMLSNYINIPVIILSSGIGFITGIDVNYDNMNIILGIGSVFVGIIKSIDSYFQLGKRAEAHRLCALQYTQINKKIQIELSLCREQRQTAKDMLSIIKTDIKNLQDISPIIDKEIIAQYNLKYGKYNNVKKPNFVNGLSEVKININSLEDEALASLSHSVRGNNSVAGGGSGSGSINGGNNNNVDFIYDDKALYNKNTNITLGTNNLRTPSTPLSVNAKLTYGTPSSSKSLRDNSQIGLLPNLNSNNENNINLVIDVPPSPPPAPPPAPPSSENQNFNTDDTLQPPNLNLYSNPSVSSNVVNNDNEGMM